MNRMLRLTRHLARRAPSARPEEIEVAIPRSRCRIPEVRVSLDQAERCAPEFERIKVLSGDQRVRSAKDDPQDANGNTEKGDPTAAKSAVREKDDETGKQDRVRGQEARAPVRMKRVSLTSSASAAL